MHGAVCEPAVQAGCPELRERSPAPQSGMNGGNGEQNANEQTENLCVGNILMAPFHPSPLKEMVGKAVHCWAVVWTYKETYPDSLGAFG